MTDAPRGFLQHLLNSVAEQSRNLVDRAGFSSRARESTSGASRIDAIALPDLARLLLTSRGEASGVVIARNIMTRYLALSDDEKTRFLVALSTDFSADPAAIRTAFGTYSADPSETALHALSLVVEPPRQDVLRRLNLAPGNTAGLVQMRADVLDRLKKQPVLQALDRDFVHLFSSWFNRGFLTLKRVDWSSPANILEKIIRYEAVHTIESWDDLRRRIDPADRRCFAFFHPALADEPLIFVEVALTESIPNAIEPILAENRAPLAPEAAKTAVFYSISNCQRGLAGISFGNFLIKQVVEELKRDLPALTTFVTLSPVPGFRQWVENELVQPTSQFLAPAERTLLQALGDGQEMGDDKVDVMDGVNLASMRAATERALACYFLSARTSSGRVIDPVARFHLGNGARLERLNPLADFSAKGWRDSYAAMVNYLYDINAIEENHEAYAIRGIVTASPSVQKALKIVVPPLAQIGHTDDPKMTKAL